MIKYAKFGHTIGLLAVLMIASLDEPNLARADDQTERTELSAGQRHVAQLIEQLGDPSFRVRAKAQQSLEKIGLPAYEQLRQAQDHSNIQIARSAEYLLRSQNVVWWLESDSYEVKARLQDYSTLDTNNRQTRLLELANVGTDDALLALARVAKFESNEICSREAALELLNKLSSFNHDRRIRLTSSVMLTLGTPNRPATEWIATYGSQLLGNQRFELNLWREYAEKLGQELKKINQTNTLVKGPREHLFKQQKQQVLKFYEWVVGWIRTEHDRETALGVARQSIDLASDNLHAAHEYCTWALSVDLPELVVSLIDKIQATSEATNGQAGVRPLLGPIDRDRHRMMYLLAEAYRKMGDETRADEAAKIALESPEKQSVMLAQLARGSLNEIIVIQRINQAKMLKDRGQFDWAEAEYWQAINANSKSETDVRMELAEMYREGKQYKQAALVMKKISTMPPPADRNLPQGDDFAEKQAYLHWYQALAAQENGDRNAAVQELLQACDQNDQCDDPNPDIVITLYRTASTSEEKAKLSSHMNKLVEMYRREISQAESNFGQQSINARHVAELCNQLAWLLASCETNVEEALYLSRRSLEFAPDEPSFVDTMARCCLAAGKLDEALTYQKQAVAASPHSRTMKSQLEEIELAIAKSKDHKADKADKAENAENGKQ